MRIHLHDGSGHPFQVQLSRVLAGRGHEVLHTYATQWVSGHGRLEARPDDPAGLRIVGITADRRYDKYSPVDRIAWEVSYARAWEAVLAANPCDVVVSCNTQLFTSALAARWMRRRGMPYVLWHQDIASFSLPDEAVRRLPATAARPVAGAVTRLERFVVRNSAAVVAIGDAFVEAYRSWGLEGLDVEVLPNWAPLDEIRETTSDAWVARVGLPPAGLRLLYAGTLGRKHNPRLLADLLDAIRARGIDASLVVASEGPGADHLMTVGSPHLHLLPFQPAEDLAAMLSSADVLVAILEADASRFSIPSKVLSYLAAGRPVLALVPADNPAATDVTDSGGLVVPPTDAGVASAARWLTDLAHDGELRRRLGESARRHAEERFAIEEIADRFERVLERAQNRRR